MRGFHRLVQRGTQPQQLLQVPRIAKMAIEREAGDYWMHVLCIQVVPSAEYAVVVYGTYEERPLANMLCLCVCFSPATLGALLTAEEELLTPAWKAQPEARKDAPRAAPCRRSMAFLESATRSGGNSDAQGRSRFSMSKSNRSSLPAFLQMATTATAWNVTNIDTHITWRAHYLTTPTND